MSRVSTLAIVVLVLIASCDAPTAQRNDSDASGGSGDFDGHRPTDSPIPSADSVSGVTDQPLDPGGPPERVLKGKAGFTLRETDGSPIVSHVGGIFHRTFDGFSQVFLQQPTGPLTQHRLKGYYISVLIPGALEAGSYRPLGGRLEFDLGEGRIYNISLPSSEASIEVEILRGVPTGTLYEEKALFKGTLSAPGQVAMLVEFY